MHIGVFYVCHVLKLSFYCWLIYSHVFALFLQISEEDIAEGFVMRTINMKSSKVLY